jgi:hypothetical protein
MNKICFVLDTHYSNYTNRLKQTILKDFLEYELYKFGIGFIITTNQPENFKEYNNKNIFIYNIDDIRDNDSITFEVLPQDPTGIYPTNFPWNLERFGLKIAGEMGYNVVINLDSDVKFNSKIDAYNFLKKINDIYEENVVLTNQAIFKYEKSSQNEIFHLHDKYLSHFGLKFEDNELDSLDGPVIIYMGKSNEDIIRFFNTWNDLTIFGYKREFGFGYGGIVCGNWSLCIPMSNFKLKWKDVPFTPHHKYEDRY